jgi:diamine N-acetyltransferase
MIIRKATTADIPFIQALADRVWREHYPDIITVEQIEWMLGAWYNADALRQQMEEDGHEFWIVHNPDGNQPTGYIALSEKPDGTHYLHKFYMEGRGQGIGARAFAEVMAQYPDLRELRLNVNRRNFKSVNFYFKVGFKIESWFDLHVGEGYIMDDFVMLWKR